jgi:hypothetical protein
MSIIYQVVDSNKSFTFNGKIYRPPCSIFVSTIRENNRLRNRLETLNIPFTVKQTKSKPVKIKHNISSADGKIILGTKLG